MYHDLRPVEDCNGCKGTAGKLGCPEHSPNVYISDQPKPFAYLCLRCPYCGKDMQLDCFKLEVVESHKMI